MKFKKYAWLGLAATLVVGLGACTKDTEELAKEDERSDLVETSDNGEALTYNVTVTIKDDSKEVIEKEVPIEEDKVLMDVMKENFEIKESKGFIESIDGLEQDPKEGKYWTYKVNGEMPMKGADELVLEDGDKVVWSLSKDTDSEDDTTDSSKADYAEETAESAE